MSETQPQLMMIQKTGYNAFDNVNVILNSLSARAQQAKRGDHPAIPGIAQALVRVMQLLRGSVLENAHRETREGLLRGTSRRLQRRLS